LKSNDKVLKKKGGLLKIIRLAAELMPERRNERNG